MPSARSVMPSSSTRKSLMRRLTGLPSLIICTSTPSSSSKTESCKTTSEICQKLYQSQAWWRLLKEILTSQQPSSTIYTAGSGIKKRLLQSWSRNWTLSAINPGLNLFLSHKRWFQTCSWPLLKRWSRILGYMLVFTLDLWSIHVIWHNLQPY